MLVNRRSAAKGERLAPATSLAENHWDTGEVGRAKKQRPCTTARGRRTVFFSSMAELVADDRLC